MATVELQIAAVPAQVRTARLVAVAAARRLGIDEESVDELRLAVGEAAARAVALHAAECPDEPVTVILDDDAGRFAVTVLDRGHPLSAPEAAPRLEELIPALGPDDGRRGRPARQTWPGFGLAVIRGLVDDVEVRALDAGTSVRMSWPVEPAAPDEPASPDVPQRSLLDL